MKQVTGGIPTPKEIKICYSRSLRMPLGGVREPHDIAEFIKTHFTKKELDYKEFMWCILLSADRILGASLIGVGTEKGVLVSQKEVTQIALLSHARAVVLVHNHPSGSLEFSPSDLRTTKRVKEALELFDIDLLDHLIITSESYLSMEREGIMPL